MTKEIGHRRKAGRTVKLTEEFVANLPKPTSNTDLWYDADLPRLACNKAMSKGAKLQFRYVISREEIRALGYLTTTPYITLPCATVAEAREKYKEVHNKVQLALSNYRQGHAPEAPEDILMDRPAEENPQYEVLMSVLMDAYAQATNGKGVDRHAGGDTSFIKQDMIKVTERVGDGFPLGQAIKKITEGRRLRGAPARHELLGAIIYIAGAIIYRDREEL